MQRSRLLPFAIPFLLFGCGRAPAPVGVPETPSPAPAPSVTAAPSAVAPIPAPTPSPTLTPSFDFESVASTVRSAVVVLAVFDSNGALTANAHGFFVSDNGKFIADETAITDAANAVAKAANGAIYNVAGALARATPQNLVLLQADTGGVPFLPANNRSLPEIGEEVAVVLSAVERTRHLTLPESVTARLHDEAGDWLDVTPALPRTAAGAPVINRRGELIGVVAVRSDSGGTCAIRSVGIIASLLAEVTPKTVATWKKAAASTPTPTPTPSASPSATRSPSPARIPLRGSKIVYAPPPRYPAEARRVAASGLGNYRVIFDGTGRATGVQIVRSAGMPALDEAAVSALRNWRATPGKPWTVIVPIAFRP